MTATAEKTRKKISDEVLICTAVISHIVRSNVNYRIIWRKLRGCCEKFYILCTFPTMIRIIGCEAKYPNASPNILSNRQ